MLSHFRGCQGFIAYGCYSYAVIVDPVTLQVIQTLGPHAGCVTHVSSLYIECTRKHALMVTLIQQHPFFNSQMAIDVKHNFMRQPPSLSGHF